MSNEEIGNQIYTTEQAEVSNRFEPGVASVLTGDMEGLKISNYQKTGEHAAARMYEVIGDSPVLEVCTGIGATTFVLARQFPRVYAVDLNPDRIKMCRDNLERLGLLHKVTFIEGDILDPEILSQLANKGIRAAYTDANFTTGNDYSQGHALNIFETGPNTADLHSRITQYITPNICMKLPKTINTEQLKMLARCEIEQATHEDGLSFYLAYYGHLFKNAESTYHFSKFEYIK